MPKLRRVPLPIALGLLVAVPLLFLGARAAGSGPTMSARMAPYNEILSTIEERYVPEANAEKAVYASLHGMLHTLDPHTNFLDPDVYREMREEQRGSFFGLGIVINKRGRYQPLRVVAPIADTPAARLGIRAGDTITHIRDVRAGVDTDTLSLTIQESVKFLRGPQGTEVEVTIDRPGLDSRLTFKVSREAVRTPAVNQTLMVAPEVGYVHIANFTETTTSELDRALDSLKQQGAKKLVLDLQGNPGGLLEEAIGVSSRFLGGGELVVYTEGRSPGSRQDYNAVRDVMHVDWPVVVLVDRGSASASEIVSGALQDHDRGLVVGETTFGKGLVQSVYPLSESAGLALTTQKYYTPVGRSIQRPYDDEEDYYLEVAQRDAVPKPAANAPSYRTPTGRTVFGGGGITPDIAVKAPEPPEILVKLAQLSAWTRFATPVGDADRARYKQQPEQLAADFAAFVAKQFPKLSQKDLKAHADEVLLQVQAELALADGGMPARDQVLLKKSPVLKRALEVLDQASALQAKRRATQGEQRAAVATAPVGPKGVQAGADEDKDKPRP